MLKGFLGCSADMQRQLAWSFAPLLAALAGAAPQASQDSSPEVVRSYFDACDPNGDGWISYREAHDTLDLDRTGYARLDTDRDGRVVIEEFRVHLALLADRVGSLPPPRSARNSSSEMPRKPSLILASYDRGGDGSLEEEELQKLLVDYRRARPPALVLLDRLDQDGDRRLRASELELLVRWLASLHLIEADAVRPASAPRSVDELFGAVIARVRTLDPLPQPALIVGPVSHFRRLDLDGDGSIELDDLLELMRPRSAAISISALFAALDANEDGLVDPEELARALGM